MAGVGGTAPEQVAVVAEASWRPVDEATQKGALAFDRGESLRTGVERLRSKSE